MATPMVMEKDPRSPQISVIVPVYNVEHYIKKCICSLLDQSFPDFEVILVDDGSTDSSGDICKNFEQGNSRIRYFKKENGGLSSARNYGLEQAAGHFVAFVDSDDYVDENYLAYLHNLIVEHRADVATSFYTTCCNGAYTPWKSTNDEVEVLTGRQALLSLLYGETINVSAVGKLYRSSLFHNIWFPLGMRYEDVATTYKVIQGSKRVAVGHQSHYFYLMRTGSLVHQIDDGLFDRSMLAFRVLSDLEQTNDEEIIRAARRFAATHSLSTLHAIDLSDQELRTRAEALRTKVLSLRSKLNSDERLPLMDRGALSLLSLGLTPYQASWTCFASLRAVWRKLRTIL